VDVLVLGFMNCLDNIRTLDVVHLAFWFHLGHFGQKGSTVLISTHKHAYINVHSRTVILDCGSTQGCKDSFEFAW
jgi:hypothetical protein